MQIRAIPAHGPPSISPSGAGDPAVLLSTVVLVVVVAVTFVVIVYPADAGGVVILGVVPTAGAAAAAAAAAPLVAGPEGLAPTGCWRQRPHLATVGLLPFLLLVLGYHYCGCGGVVWCECSEKEEREKK